MHATENQKGTNMKVLLTATMLLTSTAAFAADIVRPVPVIPPQGFTWTGVYLGGSLGYGWGNFDNTLAGNDASIGLGTNGSGFLGGVYAGYNYQMGNVVFGIESDIAWANVRGGSSINGDFRTNTGNIPWAAQIDNRLSWLGTTRGRVGYAFGNFLPYVTGGIAYGSFNTSGIAAIGSSSINASFAQSFSGSTTNVGWTVGAGLEYAITPHLLARVEYLHYDLGSTNWQVLTDPSITLNTSHNGDLARLGVAWKF